MRPSILSVAAVLASISVVVAQQGASDQGPHYVGPDAPKGSAHIVNKCSDEFFVYPVTNFHAPSPDEGVKLSPGATLSWPIIIPEKGCNCGTSFKIYDSAARTGPHTQMEYSVRVKDGQPMSISYDVSLVDCSTKLQGSTEDGFQAFSGEKCPGWSGGYKVFGTNGEGCGAMECAPNDFCPWDVYFMDIPGVYQPVRQCDDGSVDADLTFVLCSGSDKSGGDPHASGYTMPTADNGPDGNAPPVVEQGQPQQPPPPAPSSSAAAETPAPPPAAPSPSPIGAAEQPPPPPAITTQALPPPPAAQDGPGPNDVIIVVTTTIWIYPDGRLVHPRTFSA